MAITVKNLSEVFEREVFTTRGLYAGRVNDIELDLSRFRVNSITVAADRKSFLANVVGGKRGVKIPYTLIENVGDVVIIKHIQAVPQEEKASEAEMMA